MAAPSSRLWMLFSLGLAGILLISRSLLKLPNDLRAFIRRFYLPSPIGPPRPLSGLTFAISDIFDVDGFVTGFGCPLWERTHAPATRTSPVVASLVQAGAVCIGKTHMDELGYTTDGRNGHFGTPINPVATSHVPGGCCSGAAVAVAGKIVDFAVGTDAGGGIRMPAAYCGILGYRPSHGVVACTGMIPVAQSLDTVGWLARDPEVLQSVSHILLQRLPSVFEQPGRIIIAEDCFDIIANDDNRNRHLSVVTDTFGKEFKNSKITRIKLGEYFAPKLPSLKMSQVCFRVDGGSGKAHRGVSVLRYLRDAFLLLQGHEFKVNHEEWIHKTKIASGHRVSQQVRRALETSFEHVSEAMKLRNEMRIALSELLMNDGLLVIPTVQGTAPKLRTKAAVLLDFQERAMTLLSIASMSGGCQVSMPMKWHDELPSSISIIGKHGADHFLLDVMSRIYSKLQEKAKEYKQENSPIVKLERKLDTAEIAKEKGNLAFKRKDYRSAVRHYTEAINNDNGNSIYYSNRAAAYLAIQNLHQAEVDCSRAIELDEKNVKAFLRRATAREFLRCYKEADEDFRQVLLLEPTNKTAADGVKRLKKLIF